MDMRASMDLEALRASAFKKVEEKIKSLPAKEVAKVTIRASRERENWLKTQVVSKTFVLAEIPLGSVAVVGNSSVEINASLVEKPIVVDVNRKKVGRTPQSKFYPSVIVIEGAGRHNASRLSGRNTILAWVGAEALQALGLQTDNQFGSQELQDKILEKLRDRLIKKKPNTGETIGPYPWVREVYPFENYAIYSYDGDMFKQKYICDLKKRDIKFDGDPEKVMQKYVEVSGQTPMESAIQRMTPNANVPAKVTGGFMYNQTSPGSGVGARVKALPPEKSEMRRKIK